MRKPPFRWTASLATAFLLSAGGAPAWSAEPLAPSAPAADANSRDAAALDPATLLLFSVSLDGLTLTEGLGAYGAQDDPLIPVGELARLLEADIDVLPGEQRIVGRLGAARSSLVVDLRTGVARVAGREIAVTADQAAVSPTEIYLKVSLLRKLLPLTVDVASDELLLKLQATERFPVQARLARQAIRPGTAPTAPAQTDSLTVSQPYALFRPPGADVVLDAAAQQGPNDHTFRYDIRLAGDLLWSNFQAFVGSDEEGRASNARVMLQRRSLEGRLLGPLHAREITAGDTYTPGLPIGPRSVSGRGLSFSTAPLEQTNIFNRIDLRGELPPGNDVELYINDVLTSSTNQAVNGRFEFLDVPLSPGMNVLRLVTYGPRGERNEEVQVVNVGAALLRPGEAQLSFGVVEQNQEIIRIRDRGGQSTADPGLFAPNGWRTVASLNYGVNDLLSVAAGASSIPQFNGGHLGVYTLGARTSLFGLATQADVGWNSRGGEAYALGLAGQSGGVSAVLRHAEYRNGFVDENNLGFNARLELRRRSELNADTSLDLRGRIVPVSLRVVYNTYAGGSYETLAGGRASSSLGSVLLSAGFEYQRLYFRPARPREILTGYLSASTYRSFRWQIRTTLDYDILPDFKARFLSLTVDRRLSDLWSLRFGLGQPLDDFDGWNVLAASTTYATQYGDVSLTGEYDNAQDDWRVAAQWSFGLGYDPGRNRYNLTRTGPGSGGSVLFNAFIDENGDGLRQAGEAPAPNVALSGAAQRNIVTGADGRVLVTGLGAGPTAHMDVSLEKLENTSVAAPPSRLDLRPRPGSVVRVDYPLRPTGGVSIKVELLRDDGKRVGLSSVNVQLVQADGVVEGVTEFDGTAVLDAVPTGTYRLQLDPRQAARLRMRLLESPVVTIKGDGDFAPDVTVQVRFDPAPPETEIARSGGAK